MALPYTETCTDSNGTALQTHDANWVINAGAFDIQSNELQPNNAGDSMAHYTGETPDADQQVSAPVVALSGDIWVGIAVRVAATGLTGYAYLGRSNLYELALYLSGSYYTLGTSPGVAWTVTDVITLKAEGTTITPLINGGADPYISPQTDSNIASGWWGVVGYRDGPSRIDDITMSNLGGTPPSGNPLAMHYYRMRRQ